MADAVVVDHTRENGRPQAIVEYIGTDGMVHRSIVSSQGWIAPGTELEVSYRTSDPSTVRVPSEALLPGYLGVVFPMVFLAGLALWKNPWSAERDRVRLDGVKLRDPELLLRETKPLVEPDLGTPIHAAIPMLERRSLTATLLPFSGLLVGIVIVGAIAGVPSEASILGMGAAVAGVAILSIGRRRGVMVVTDDEYVLFVLKDKNLMSTTLGGRLPRATVLPPVQIHKYTVYGGPIPFSSPNDAKQWHYAAANVSAGHISYYDLIRDLVLDSKARAQDPRHRDDSWGSAFAGVHSSDPRPHEVADGSTLTSAEAYLKSIAELERLVDQPVVGAFPLRPLRDHLGGLSYFYTRRGHSVLVTKDTWVVTSNRTHFREPKVKATLSRHAPLNRQLAKHGLRVDKTLGWVDNYIEQLTVDQLTDAIRVDPWPAKA